MFVFTIIMHRFYINVGSIYIFDIGLMVCMLLHNTCSTMLSLIFHNSLIVTQCCADGLPVVAIKAVKVERGGNYQSLC